MVQGRDKPRTPLERVQMLIITSEMRVLSGAWTARQAELVPDMGDPRTPVEALLAGLITEREFWSLVISNDQRAPVIRKHLRARFRSVSDHDVATVLATLGADTAMTEAHA